jgi:hypothetical protein
LGDGAEHHDRPDSHRTVFHIKPGVQFPGGRPRS